MGRGLPFMVLLVVLPSACGGSGGSPTDQLQSSCVHGYLSLDRTLADGTPCSNFGYSDCGNDLASECIGYCGFDLCQAQECTSDADCARYGRVCQAYQVEGSVLVNFGNWCAVSSCPPGTAGCPCQNGSCTSPYQCSAQNVCVDTCPSGCRQGSVCCGGAFCSGDCIGTPCC